MDISRGLQRFHSIGSEINGAFFEFSANSQKGYRFFMINKPNGYAQYQLGKMCRDGIGTEANLEKVKQWFAGAYIGFLN